MYLCKISFDPRSSRDNLTVNVFSFIAQCILQQLSAFSYALLCCAINRSFAQGKSCTLRLAQMELTAISCAASLLANGFSIVFILTSGYLIVSLPVWIAWARWLSPYFYGEHQTYEPLIIAGLARSADALTPSRSSGFHWIARLQFEGRIFACDGVTGVARNQCEGTAVLIGLRFPLSTPVYVYPLGLLGFVIVTIILATLLLSTYHPGGVKHAAAQASQKEVVTKEKRQSEMLLQRKGVNVRVDKLALTVSMRTATRAKVDKVILREVDAEFPSGEVSVIMGPSGVGPLKASLLFSPCVLTLILNRPARVPSFKSSPVGFAQDPPLDSPQPVLSSSTTKLSTTSPLSSNTSSKKTTIIFPLSPFVRPYITPLDFDYEARRRRNAMRGRKKCCVNLD